MGVDPQLLLVYSSARFQMWSVLLLRIGGGDARSTGALMTVAFFNFPLGAGFAMGAGIIAL
jgi:hypothetical protein